MKRKFLSIVTIIILLLSTIPLPLNVLAATNEIPFYQGKNEMLIFDLVPGHSLFYRVDKTAPVDLYVGDYRYATIYDGRIGDASTRTSDNRQFPVQGTGSIVKAAYQNDKWYHVVPKNDVTLARNIIKVGELTPSEFQNIYGGNSNKVFDEIPQYIVEGKDGVYGYYYYIGDIARLSGGYAINTGPSFDGVNPTRLQYLKTAWTDINTFSTNKTNFNVNEAVKFNFDGWEYVYGNSGVSYEIKIKKDGKLYADGVTGNASSTKGSKSTISPKQDEGHTGKFTVNGVTGFIPTESGTYEAVLTVFDQVQRYDTKIVAFTVTNPNEPSLLVLPPTQSIDVGGTAQYQAIYKDENGNETDVTKQATWSADDTSIGLGIGQGKFTGLVKGNTPVKAEYSELEGKAILYVDQEAVEPEPTETNEPPTVEIVAPDEVEIGEKFCVQANAQDSDGYIVYYDWNGYSGELDDDEDAWTSSRECSLYYENVTEDNLWVQVTDDDGATAEDTHEIKVVYPTPNANFKIKGYPIENRAVWFEPSAPYKKTTKMVSAIRIVKNIWTIEALDENNKSSIVVIEDDLNNSKYDEVIQVLFRKAGEYKVTRYIENKAGLHDTVAKTVTITEDMLPTAQVETAEKVYLKENGKKTVTFYSKSYSFDDFIGAHIYEIAHDSDNDGSFDDEVYEVFKSNEKEFKYEVTKLGKYAVRYTAIETFNEPTYESHVNLSDDLSKTHRKYAQTTTTFEVDNMAPVVSLSAMEQPEVEIVFNTGDVIENSKYTKGKLESNINNTLLPSLAAENIKADIRVEEPTFYEDAHLQLASSDTEKGSGKTYLIDYAEGIVKQTGVKYYDFYSGIRMDGTTLSNGDVVYVKDNDWTMFGYTDDLKFDGFALNYFDVDQGVITEIVPPSTFLNLTGIEVRYDDKGNVWNMYDHRAGKSIIDIAVDLAVTNDDNILVAYKILHDSNGYYNKASDTYVYFVKYSKSGQLLDWGKHTYRDKDFVGNLEGATEEFIIFDEYDGAGLDGTKIYDAESTLDQNYIDVTGNYDVGTLLYTIDDDDTVKDMMLTKDKLIIITTSYSNNDLRLNYYAVDRNTKQSVKKIVATNDSYLNGYDLISHGNHFITRDGKVVFDVTYENGKSESSAQWIANMDGASPLIEQTLPYGTVPVPYRYLPNETFVNIEYKGGYNFRWGKVRYYNESNYTHIKDLDSLPLNDIRPDDSYSYKDDKKTRYGTVTNNTQLSLFNFSIPITKGYKKSLTDTLADTKWKSKTSTKFYVTLSDKDISDLPKENKEVASLLNQDDINYISIDTNSTKSLAQQVMNAIEQESMQYTTTTYNDMDKAMTRITEFIVGVVFPEKDKTVDIHIGVDDSQYSLATVQNAVNTLLKPRLDATGIKINVTTGALINKTVNGQSVRKFNTNIDNEYYVLFKDSALTERNLAHMVGDLLIQDAYFVGIGGTLAESQFNNAIRKNMYRGTALINPTDLSQVMEDLGDYLIETIRMRASETVIYSTTEETNNVLYQAHYTDYEEHPKYTDKYETIHEPTVFENDEGKVTFGTASLPQTFTKVGLYQPTYQAMDDPVINYMEPKKTQFASYRKWSNIAGNVKVYMHRLPNPEFKLSVNVDTNVYSVTNAAYDLDKESINIGLGNGIAAQNWQWRKKGEAIWKDGLPPNPLQEAVYEVKNEVIDFQHQKNYLIKELHAIPIKLPPVAQFEPNPYEIGTGQTVQLINSSYEPTDQNMTAVWEYKHSSSNTWLPLTTGTYINGVGNAGWSPSTNVFTQLGTYDVRLTVTDSDGMSDSTREVIVTNAPPEACMIIPTPNYIGDTIVIQSCASDPDGDPLSYRYVVKKPNGNTLTYSTGHSSIDSNGNLTIRVNNPNEDIGTWRVTQTVDDGNATASANGQFVVINQTIEGAVTHTQQWLRNLQKYNLENPNNKFNLDANAGPVDFIPGEKFILNSTESTTNRLVDVKAYIVGSSRGINYRSMYGTETLIRQDSRTYTGSLWDESMIEQFRDGEVLTFEFVGTFANGWVDKDTVQIKIKDEPYWRQHTTY